MYKTMFSDGKMIQKFSLVIVCNLFGVKEQKIKNTFFTGHNLNTPYFIQTKVFS